jgi:hypothetical protein
MTDEKELREENKAYLLMALMFVVAIVINPFVKLKDWLKGEPE